MSGLHQTSFTSAYYSWPGNTSGYYMQQEKGQNPFSVKFQNYFVTKCSPALCCLQQRITTASTYQLNHLGICWRTGVLTQRPMPYVLEDLNKVAWWGPLQGSPWCQYNTKPFKCLKQWLPRLTKLERVVFQSQFKVGDNTTTYLKHPGKALLPF